MSGLRLSLDSEFSPPSEQLAQTRQDLYVAYNRPAFSRISRPIVAYVVDDIGRRVTTGPAASMQVVASIFLPFNYYSSSALSPSERDTLGYLGTVTHGIDDALHYYGVLLNGPDGLPIQSPSHNLGTVREVPSLIPSFPLSCI